MDYEKLTRDRREITKAMDVEGFVSDQQRGVPQPPLVKAAGGGARVKLPTDFSGLTLKNDAARLIGERESRRVYTGERLSLSELSFLLWATQGVKGIRGKSYATLRTVPSGGARHAFETYLAVKDVDGLEPGRYRYLPMEHELEYLGEIEDYEHTVSESLDGQRWGAKAAVVFYWSYVAYRAEWRYGMHAHRIALIDAGHVGQALYVAAEALGRGCCAVGAFDMELCDALFGLDGEDEFVIYCSPVGAVSAADREKELAFYAWLKNGVIEPDDTEN